MTSVFVLENVDYEIAEIKILYNINIKINEDTGLITGIIGPSGSGKSTLLRLLNDLISPSSGRITFKERNLQEIPPKELRKKVGYIQQRPYLFNGSVKSNIQYGPNIWRKHLTDDCCKDILEKVGLEPEFLERNVDTLSGGQQQRVAIARVLANEPDVVLMDEPTSSLDIAAEERVEETIVSLAHEGIKIIIVTHSLEQTRRLTNNLFFLSEGKILEQKATDLFFEEHPEEEIKALFMKKDTRG